MDEFCYKCKQRLAARHTYDYTEADGFFHLDCANPEDY